MSIFFSGFCLKDEKEIFSEFLQEGDFNISGFSYGAIKAFEYASSTINRVNKLQLFSPAFFQDKDKKFKRTQLMFFKKDPITYCDNFFKNVTGTSQVDIIKYFKMGKEKELEELLNYEWDIEKINRLKQRGTIIEVYLGNDDKIIDANVAREFFKNYAEVYYIKDVGHTLQ